MVFERYIHRHGKKLGPYYYENIRSNNGKVKTVYVGTNPSNHQKHKIRKPLFFLILVLILILILGTSLFLLQNKSYLIKKVSLQEPDFDVDQLLLKVLIRSGEFMEKQVRVMNTGDKPAAINVEVSGLSDIVKADSGSFSIKPGQTKIVTLKFSSFNQEQQIEQQPGIYVGKLVIKSEKATKEIPIVVEIETKNVLFDTNLNPVAIERKIKPGTDAAIEVRLFNLESIESTNVDVEYFVKDMNGNTISTESETVVVKTQASFFKTISAPKSLKPGPYVFAAQSKFGNSIGTASYLFEVAGQEAEASFVEFCKNNILCMGLSLTTVLLLFAVAAYFYFFIGAYLYEKVAAFASRKRKQKAKIAKEYAPETSIFGRIKNKIKELKEKREVARAEEARLASLKNAKPSKNLVKFYGFLNESEEAIASNDAVKVENLYAKARDIYVSLPRHEEQKVYGELMKLYKQRNQLAEKQRKQEEIERKQAELKSQKEAKTKQREEEQQIKGLEKERLAAERREKLKEIFHKIGLYKTPEEKKQIALQKERQRQERLKAEEELKRQRDLEAKKAEEQKRLEAEKLKGERKRQQLEDERRRIKEIREQERLKKQQEREAKKALERQKRLEAEIKSKAEQEKRQQEKEKLKAEEELREKIEVKEEKPEEKKEGLLKSLFKKKGPEAKLEEPKKEPQEEKTTTERKPGLFAKLFSRKKSEEEQAPESTETIFEGMKELAAAEEVPEKEKPKSEADELEEAIKGLDLFKEIEKGKPEIQKKKPGMLKKLLKGKEAPISKEKKEKVEKVGAKEGIFGRLFGKKIGEKAAENEIPEKEFAEKLENIGLPAKEEPQAKTTGRSKKFEKCKKALDNAKEAIAKDNLAKAKKHYVEARKLYVDVDYSEKKELYNDLMEMYDGLK